MQKGSDEISNRDSKKTGELGSSRLVILYYYHYYNNNNYYYSLCLVTRRRLFDSKWEETCDARLLPMCVAQSFLLHPSSALENAPQMRSWVGAWVKPLVGVSFLVLYLIPLHSPPFFLSISMANLPGMAVISGSQHCLFYLWLLCCF